MIHLEAIRARLTQDAAVTALVGARVYPLVAKQIAAVPFIVLTTVSDVPENSMDSAPSTRLRVARLQVDCYSKTHQEAHQVADAVHAVVGALAEADLGARLESQQDLYDDETQLFRVSADYFVAI
jgi:hypothetical protein